MSEMARSILLPSDPSLAYYQIVKDWGTKWVNRGEITQPALDCILNVRAKPGKNYGLIKTHKPNNPIGLITSGTGQLLKIYLYLQNIFTSLY